MNPYNLEIAARERHKDLLRAAEADRLSQQLPTDRTTRLPPTLANLSTIFIAVGQRLKLLANTT